MKTVFRISFFSIGLFSSSLLYAFDTYGFIPWSLKEGKNVVSNQIAVKQKLAKNGIQSIDVVYHSRMLTNGVVDNEKIKKIAQESQSNIPISFDIEIGNRNNPETILPTVIEVIDLYHAYGGKAPIGVYSTLPQSSVGGKNLSEKSVKRLVELNKQYEVVAQKVDFLSPVFYFSDGDDFENWRKAVDFNMSQSLIYAKKYNLKIYPYITNSFKESAKNKNTGGWVIRLLNQNQMYSSLCYLKGKGADGVIIWTSSQVIDQNGVKPVIKFNQPWFRGVKDFKKNCK